MPQGGGGAQAAGRFYRNAALSLSGSTPVQIGWDTDSAILTPYGLARSSGRIQVGVTGPAFGSVTVRQTGILTLQSMRLVVTRVRSGSPDLVVLDERRLVGGILADFSLAFPWACEVAEGDELDFGVSANGVSLSLVTSGELNTWMYMGVG